MHKFLLAAALAAALSACQSTAEVNPSAELATLSANDPKFDTPQCQAARQRQAEYAETTGKAQFAVEFAIWANVGYGMPVSAERQALNRDLRTHCVSGAT